MKKMFLILSLLFATAATFAQSSTAAGTDNSVFEIVGTFAGSVSLIVLITGYIKTWLKWDGTKAKYLSVAVSIVISLFGWILNVGIFEPIQNWWVSLLYGFGLSLAANGLFKYETVQSLLTWLLAQIPKK